MSYQLCFTCLFDVKMFAYIFNIYLYIWLLWVLAVACEVQFPDQGIEPWSCELGVQSLSHWTTKEVPRSFFYLKYIRLKAVLLIPAHHFTNYFWNVIKGSLNWWVIGLEKLELKNLMIGITWWLCSVAQLFQNTCSSWEMLVCLFFSSYMSQKNLFIFYTKFLLTTSTCRELALSLSCLCTILLLITLYCS